MTTTAPTEVEVEAPAAAPAWSGQSVPRKEDRRLLQGQGVFVDDIKRHGMGYIHFVRSPYAHAHITSIDVSKATSTEGRLRDDDGRGGRVAHRAVLPALDAARARTSRTTRSPSARCGTSARPSSRSSRPRRELARDASELVEVEYEPIDPVVDARYAQGEDVPVLHEDSGSNLMWEGVYEWGDLDAAFAEADKIVKISELHFHRFNSTPLETDGALVEFNRGVGPVDDPHATTSSPASRRS